MSETTPLPLVNPTSLTTSHDTPITTTTVTLPTLPTPVLTTETSIPASDSGQQTTFCPHCTLRLSYPAGSNLIQCPQCVAVIDPLAPQQTRCVQCRCLLAYPGSSIYIQCPNCYQTQDPRAVPLAFTTYLSRNPDGQSKTKKRKDPSAPKAACNAYMIFCQMRRAELKVTAPDLPFGKVGAKLGEIWRNMTIEEKKPYEDLAEEDKERYRKEMLAYQATKLAENPDPLRRRVDESGASVPAAASTDSTTTTTTASSTSTTTTSETATSDTTPITSTTSSTSSTIPVTAPTDPQTTSITHEADNTTTSTTSTTTLNPDTATSTSASTSTPPSPSPSSTSDTILPPLLDPTASAPAPTGRKGRNKA